MDVVLLKKHIETNYENPSTVNIPKYFYEVTFEKLGGLVLPILVEYTYEDGTKDFKHYPAQIWSKNDDAVKKVIASDKAIVEIHIDPNLETADVDTSNNVWPRKEKSEFDLKKEALQN